MREPIPQLDPRDVARIVAELLARRPGYVPAWQPGERGASAALAWIFARYLYAVLQRLNRAPEKNKFAFLDLLGLGLVPASAARVPVVFQLAADAADSRITAGAQVSAPPPPDSADQIVFEVERGMGIAAAQLQQVFSLWPGRDQYIDHSAAALEGRPFEPFRKPHLIDTPHELYIAHDAVLALAGQVSVEVEFELKQPGGEPLSVLWQYWDGKVWRGFKSARPACSEKEAAQLDSTAGLTHSGKFRLEADCAESAKRAVNGVEGFWIRAQLTEVLPPDPATALPLVESIRLRTLFDQPLKATLTPVIVSDAPRQSGPGSRLHGRVMNEAGQLLEGVAVRITDPLDGSFNEKTVTTKLGAEAGQYDASLDSTNSGQYDVRVSFLSLEGASRLKNIDSEREMEVDLTFNVVGLDPDKAFADGAKLDVSSPFFPFGQQPQPGSTFYIRQDEVFAKPGAKVQMYVARTTSPQDKLNVAPDTTGDSGPIGIVQNQTETEPLEHLVAWEYWNGRRWVTMFQSSSKKSTLQASSSSEPPSPVADLDVTEIISFEVPVDIAATKVNDEEGYWIRARLVSGGYGFTQVVHWRDSQTERQNRLTYVVSRPPALAALRFGYAWQEGPVAPQRVIAFNDFQYEDRTEEAVWPGNAFAPFRRVNDLTPALYLGFDRRFPSDRIGLYFDIVERPGETRGPAMTWEYFDGSGWRRLAVEDETGNLRLPGLLSFVAASDSQPLARFGQPLHWLRGRLKEDGPPGEPLVNAIFLNAAWASQRQTFTDVPLGASTGLPNQTLRFTQIPVLAGERIEVREISGARANVEWRVLAMSLFGGDAKVVRELEEMLGREGPQVDIERDDLRLTRDANKRVVEVWVRWNERPHLFASGPEDRHYVIDRARGLVFFGDGTRGKIPPPGAQVLSRRHASGGGLAGNVAARAIQQALTPIPGLQSVFNPRPAEGGADGERVEAFGERGPLSVRHRGRAVMPSDYETLAREASPAVAFARAIPTRGASGRPLPGWVTLIIVPQSSERRPWPSFGLREHVRRYLEERAPADIVASRQIFVTGPEYMAVDVEATIAARDAGEAGAVEQRARQALENFLHPLGGGPEGRGWEMGRAVYLSDVAAVLERVEGVDFVKELALLKDGQPRGERFAVRDAALVVAGDIRLKLE